MHHLIIYLSLEAWPDLRSDVFQKTQDSARFRGIVTKLKKRVGKEKWGLFQIKDQTRNLMGTGTKLKLDMSSNRISTGKLREHP